MTRPTHRMTFNPAATVAIFSSATLSGPRSLMLFKPIMAAERERERNVSLLGVATDIFPAVFSTGECAGLGNTYPTGH